MQQARRYYVRGGSYFFTVVTQKRQCFLCEEFSRSALIEAIHSVRAKYPFEIIAWVLLPDHLHCIWKMPEGDSDFSTRWNLIKKGFSLRVKKQLNTADKRTKTQTAKRELGIWQSRFWEHCLRDENDLLRHFEYIHWNPVKHKLVNHPADWPWSTYHRYVNKGFYNGREKAIDLESNPDIGGE